MHSGEVVQSVRCEPGAPASVLAADDDLVVEVFPDTGGRRILTVPAPVPPKVTLALEAPAGLVWITLLDWTTGQPLPGHEIQLLTKSPQDQSGALSTLLTNQHGQLLVPPKPGTVTRYATADTTASEASPHAVTILCPTSGGAMDHRVTLVTPPPRWPVTVQVESMVQLGAVVPLVYLERIAGGSPMTVPIGGALPGRTVELQTQLPAGTYALGVAPPGSFLWDGDTGIEVGEGLGSALQITVLANPDTCKLELLGVTRPELPVRVLTLDPLQQCIEVASAPWIGPTRWGRAVADVGTNDRPRRILSIGRTEQRISRDIVTLNQSNVAVPMDSATEIDIRVPRSPGELAATVFLVADDGFDCAQSMAPVWAIAGGAGEAVWQGRIFVPSGSVEASLVVDGRDLGTRTIDAHGKVVEVREWQ